MWKLLLWSLPYNVRSYLLSHSKKKVIKIIVEIWSRLYDILVDWKLRPISKECYVFPAEKADEFSMSIPEFFHSDLNQVVCCARNFCRGIAASDENLQLVKLDMHQPTSSRVKRQKRQSMSQNTQSPTISLDSVPSYFSMDDSTSIEPETPSNFPVQPMQPVQPQNELLNDVQGEVIAAKKEQEDFESWLKYACDHSFI